MLRSGSLAHARRRTLALPRLALSRRDVAALGAASTAGVALAFYLTTLAPTVMWYDMGEFVVASETLGIAHNTGYPLLILLGKLFTFLPVGDTAYRVNLMSAIFTALAVAVTFSIVHDLTDDPLAAAVAALTLAFTSTVWANATWATSYGPNLFFTALITRLMFAWHRDQRPVLLIAAALTFGLALCNHRLIVLVVPPSAMLVALHLRGLDRRTIVLAAAALVAGLSVYLYLPIRGEQEPALSWARPAEWRTYLSMFLNGSTPSEYWRFSDVTSRLHILRGYPSYDLTWAGLLLAGAGLAVCALRHRAIAAFCAIFLALNAFVVVTYSIHNIYNYLTPAYLILCVLAGVAVARIMELIRSTDAARWAPAVVGALFLMLPAALVAKNVDRVDRSDDYAAYDFARTTLERLPAHAVILTDSWTAPPLWYVQLVEGNRRDVFVTPIFSSPGADPIAFARTQLDAGRPVYVAEGLRTPIAALDHDYVLQPLLLNGIETMVTDVLPKPEYRDDLVARGSLYRLLEESPSAMVASVPPDAARDISFDSGVTLVGFETDGDLVDGGGVIKLTYYWRADHTLESIAHAVTLFADATGHIAERHGWPRWHHSRQIAANTLEADAWTPGTIIRESYFVLVPRDTDPGTYAVRLAAYEGAASPEHARQQAAKALVTVGQIVVR